MQRGDLAKLNISVCYFEWVILVVMHLADHPRSHSQCRAAKSHTHLCTPSRSLNTAIAAFIESLCLRTRTY